MNQKNIRVPKTFQSTILSISLLRVKHGDETKIYDL